jgi:hypothetical protein
VAGRRAPKAVGRLGVHAAPGVILGQFAAVLPVMHKKRGWEGPIHELNHRPPRVRHGTTQLNAVMVSGNPVFVDNSSFVGLE